MSQTEEQDTGLLGTRGPDRTAGFVEGLNAAVVDLEEAAQSDRGSYRQAAILIRSKIPKLP